MTHFEIAKLVETQYLNHSAYADFLGKNVRCPSLVKGGLYVMKEWSVKHKTNSDNPYTVVEFLGSGKEVNGTIKWFDENPSIKDMQSNDRFFFKAYNSKGETIQFGAYMHECCVCIGNSAVRITCYAVRGHEIEAPVSPAKAPPAANTVRTTQNTAAPVAKREARTFDDKGEMCPGVLVDRKALGNYLTTWYN